jgi:hypothetical protein
MEGSGDVASMTPVIGDGNREGEVMGCGRFRRGRGGGGKEAPRCWRWTTKQRAMWWSRRPKAAAAWSMMTNGNWVDGLNARLDRTIE